MFIPLSKDKILDRSKLKAFADDKINLNKNSKFVFGRVENIVGKGENAAYQHFLLFTQSFQKPSHSELLKMGIVWYRVNNATCNSFVIELNDNTINDKKNGEYCLYII